MFKKKWILNNFKMYGMKENYLDYIKLLKSNIIPEKSNSEKILFEYIFFPSSLFMHYFYPLMDKKFMHLGLQNVYSELKGPYTGEMSLTMIQEMHIKYVLLGHSERRYIFHENSELIRNKLIASLKSNITPVLCIGEKEPLSNKATEIFLKKELEFLFSKLLDHQEIQNEIIIAYEPSWCINQELAAGLDIIINNINSIKQFFSDNMDSKYIHIVYGGSVNENNIIPILSEKEIDGVLLGRSCIDSLKWINMITKIANVF